MRAVCVFVLGVVALSTARADAAFITNGSFELPGAGFRTVLPGQTFGGWTCIGPSDIEFVHAEINGSLPGLEASAYHGEYWIDLTGVGAPSGISQNVATVPGQAYEVGFALAGNVWSGAQLMIMDVLWNGVSVGTFQHNTAGHTGFDMGWTEYGVPVVGTGNDVLTFRGLTGGRAAGAALDGVSIRSVPAPASFALAALGLTAGARRRR